MTWDEAYRHYCLLYGHKRATKIIELAFKSEAFRKMAEKEPEPVFRQDWQRMADFYRSELDDLIS